MPRPKPRMGASSWTAEPFVLRPEQRRNLAHYLGFSCRAGIPETANVALLGVEKWLGFYQGAISATATAPRASVKRGRPIADARAKVIDELRRVFQKHYRGDDAPRPPKRGTTIKLSLREQNETEFVSIALDAATIPHFDDIRRHFTAPGAAILYAGDRMSQITKLAAKVRQDRLRRQAKKR